MSGQTLYKQALCFEQIRALDWGLKFFIIKSGHLQKKICRRDHFLIFLLTLLYFYRLLEWVFIY